MSLRRLCQLTGGGGGIAEDEVVEAGVCNSLGGGEWLLKQCGLDPKPYRIRSSWQRETHHFIAVGVGYYGSASNISNPERRSKKFSSRIRD